MSELVIFRSLTRKIVALRVIFLFQTGLHLILVGFLGFLILEGSVLAQVIPLQQVAAQPRGERVLQGHVSEISKKLTSTGRVPATNELHLAIGVSLRDPAGLGKFLADVYNPASPNYRHFLKPGEFTARFSATEADYSAVKNFALTNGFKITSESSNRLLLDVTAKAADVERAFHLKLNTFKHPTEAREFFAPDTEPTVDAALALADVQGLSDYSRPHPKSYKMDPKAVTPRSGSAPDGSGAFFGNDFLNAYVPGTTLTGAGQQVGLLQFDGFYPNDIAAYAAAAGNGRTDIPIQTVLIDSYSGGVSSTSGNDEVSLDIEMAMAMAPGLAEIVVFEESTKDNPNDVLNAMAASSTVKNLSCSWGWGGGPSTTTDTIFQNMAAQGQSFFNASGDSDAFTTGASSVNGVDNNSLANAPSSSPYITQVGGTSLTMNGTGASYGSEVVWNTGEIGSSGGISSYYSIPGWQQGINMSANGGSTSMRNIPDVALVAQNIYVVAKNGQAINMEGTSAAAPLWAGFMALVNQQLAANGAPPIGFLNPALYAIGQSTNYTACFHDITTGNNTNADSPTSFYAAAGYDLCTGLGTIGGTNLINALAPGAIVPFTVLHSFTGGSDGAQPYAGLILSGNTLYGTAWEGGSSGYGTVFAVNTNGTGFTTLHSFTGGSDGARPYAGVILSGNTLYGTAADGGSSGNGTVFKVNTNGAGFTILDSFIGGGLNVYTNIGDAPFGGLILSGNTLYGTTAYGGSFGGGTVFAVNTDGTGLTTPYSFNSGVNDGVQPYAGLILSGNTLYGTTIFGASSFDGTVFAVNTDGTGYRTLHNFTGGSDGSEPFSGLILSGNTLYGTAVGGGSSGTGTVFKLNTDGTGFTILYSFTAVPAYPGPYINSDGAAPQAGLILSGNTLYGTAGSGGSSGKGTVFKLNTDGTSFSNLHSLNGSSDGAGPVAGLILSGNTLYGTTFEGGSFGGGTVFSLKVLPPYITIQPYSQSIAQGANATFEVTVGGNPALTYQWQFNGGNLATSTNASLTITNVQPWNAGSYDVIVTNDYGAITSAVVTLTIGTPSTPPQIITSGASFGFQTNQFGFNINGFVGQTIVVDGSTNLINWTPLLTNSVGSSPFYFFDPASTNFRWRFYRVSSP
jgi:uncharacterized repeat protein (TIGR03803 family)